MKEEKENFQQLLTAVTNAESATATVLLQLSAKNQEKKLQYMINHQLQLSGEHIRILDDIARKVGVQIGQEVPKTMRMFVEKVNHMLRKDTSESPSGMELIAALKSMAYYKMSLYESILYIKAPKENKRISKLVKAIIYESSALIDTLKAVGKGPNMKKGFYKVMTPSKRKLEGTYSFSS